MNATYGRFHQLSTAQQIARRRDLDAFMVAGSSRALERNQRLAC